MQDEKSAPQAEEKAASTSEGKVQETETEKTPQTEASTEEKSAEAKTEKKPAWFTRVIAREAAEKREAKREAEVYKRQNAELLAALADKSGNTGESKPKTDTTAVPHTEVEKRALEIVQKREFDQACNKIAEHGNDSYEDFQESIGVLQSFGSGYEKLLEVATEIPDAHRLLHHLGKNPEEAERLLSLPPTKMAIGLAKLETEMSKGKAISNAPAPVKPIAAKSKASFDPNDPDCDRQEWSRWREKTRRKR